MRDVASFVTFFIVFNNAMWSLSKGLPTLESLPRKMRMMVCLMMTGHGTLTGKVHVGDIFIVRETVPGGNFVSSKRLMGMCCWMGLHFHNWIDCNGVTFLVVTKMGLHIFRISGIRKFW